MLEHYDLRVVYCISWCRIFCRILSGKNGMSTIEQGEHIATY